jgi:hypothetical protein
MSYGGQCVYCGEPVQTEHAAYRITGIEYTRDQGGANVIHDRERQPNWIAHKLCAEREIDKKRRGIHPDQSALV